ncbi:MAG: Gfo/Idh/MocA family oxidoreductase [Ruminococcaceae bacterium]|nr:Gfo/Idh/MocA family oxidoreductase [Oscillospiraceae bacterium]
MKDIRIGTIGCGGIANGVHLPGIRNASGAQIAALCDIIPDRLHAAGEKYGVPMERRFTDYRQLIACPEVDAVDICTPNSVHVPAAMAAVEAGKPFCCEKPLGIGVDECLALEEAARTAGLPAMVCFSYRFKPAVRYAKHLAEQGMLGNILTFYAQYFKSSAFMKDRRLDWRFEKKIANYGVSGDLGVHLLDLASFLSGDVIALTADMGIAVTHRKRLDSEEIAAVDTDDFCHFLAKFDSGASATFSITRAAFGNRNQIRVEVYGDKGALRFDLNRDDELEYYTGGIKEGDAINHMEKLTVPEEFKTSQMQCFVDLLHGNPDRYTPTLRDGVKLQRVLDAILESDEKRAWVNI